MYYPYGDPLEPQNGAVGHEAESAMNNCTPARRVSGSITLWLLVFEYTQDLLLFK